MTQCHVASLRLYNFRNYAEAHVDFDAGLNVITGANAQGKTNLVEAVVCLAMTRSPRASSNAEEMRWGTLECAIDGCLIRDAGDVSLELRLVRDADGERVTRTMRVDGKPRHGRDVLGLCPVVLFSPDDLQLVKAGPDGRRRRLDMLLSQVDKRLATELLRYRRVVEQRNALLRQAQSQGIDLAALDSFTAELIRYGARIRTERFALVSALDSGLRTALNEISGGDEGGELRYTGCATDDTDAAAGALGQQLDAVREMELLRGVTLAGPHRDDVEIILNSRSAKAGASQGQQRSLVLALVLAEVARLRDLTGVPPVVVLDDVLSELDRSRRAHLLSTLSHAGAGQVFVTTCESPEEVGLPGGHRLEVVDGQVMTREAVA